MFPSVYDSGGCFNMAYVRVVVLCCPRKHTLLAWCSKHPTCNRCSDNPSVGTSVSWLEARWLPGAKNQDYGLEYNRGR